MHIILKRFLRGRSRGLACVIAVISLVGLSVGSLDRPAAAVVVHGTGYEATVAGWTSWYGSYVLGGLGPVWCIDHGLHAPDSDYGYGPAAPPAVPRTSSTAMAWILGRYGSHPTRIQAAALMLALHDLNGAVYPQGPLQLATMSQAQFAGFEGDDVAVFTTAREMVQDGLGHGGLIGPLSLRLDAPAKGEPGVSTPVSASVRDATGRGVSGITVTFQATGADLRVARGVTDAAGRVTTRLTSPTGRSKVSATAQVPGLDLAVYGPAGAPAQRVARPSILPLSAAAGIEPVPPSTTTTTTTTVPPTTTSTTTTTTVPPTTTSITTTTTVPPTTTSTTTTTVPPTTTSTTTTTTVPPTPTSTTTTTSSTTTTVSPTTTSTTPPTTTSTVPGPTPSIGSARPTSGQGGVNAPEAAITGSGASTTLPATGSPARDDALIAIGLIGLGIALVLFVRGAPRTP